MARTKNYTKLIEQLQKKMTMVDEKMDNLNIELKKLESEKCELEASIDSLKMEQLMRMLDEKGLTIDQVANMVAGEERE